MTHDEHAVLQANEELCMELLSEVSFIQDVAIKNSDELIEKSRIVIIDQEGRVIREETVDTEKYSKRNSILCPIICNSDFLLEKAGVSYYLFLRNRA